MSEQEPNARDYRRVLENLERGLADALPGLELCEREVQSGDKVIADFVGVDPLGRLVLVLLAEDDGDRAVLAALDALAFARANRGLFARVAGARPIDHDAEPLCVLISERFDQPLLERLRSVGSDGVLLLELRELGLGGRSSAQLVPVEVAHAGPRPRDVGQYLDALPDEVAPLGRELFGRIGRIDEELEPECGPLGVAWRWRGRALCTLACAGSHFESVLPGGAVHAVTRSSDVDPFVEHLLVRQLALSEQPEDELDEFLPLSAERSASEEVLLTPEEIEAFRTTV